MQILSPLRNIQAKPIFCNLHFQLGFSFPAVEWLDKKKVRRK